jgi:glycosyltransferase involved in cell wall biosynthesis
MSSEKSPIKERIAAAESEPMEKIQCSVCILTYNEEKNNQECLESVTWADEIIILDSFSTDRTLEICRKYSDRIYQQKFGGFGPQRNAAVQYASHDWVLSVDADERVTEELREEIRKKLSSPPEADAYFVPRKSHFLGKEIRHCGWYPDYRQLQLFNKMKMIYRSDRVHEGYQLSSRASCLHGHILHFPFSDVEEFLRKMTWYSSLAAEDMIEAGRAFRFYQLFTHPLGNFIKIYFIKQGFRDGRHGLILSLLYAYYSFLKYLRFWEKSSQKK